MIRITSCVKCLTVSALIVTGACSSSDTPTQDLAKNGVVSVQVPANDLNQIDFSKYIEAVELIPLESPEEALVGDVYNLSYHAEKFYLFDRMEQELFVFSTNGEFLFKMNKRGRGPGEYLEMRDVKVDDQGLIYILSYQRIHVYDSDGAPVRTIELSGLQEKGVNPTGLALAFDEGFYLYVGAFGIREPQDDRYAVYKVDLNGHFGGHAWFPVINNGAEFPRFAKVPGQQAYLYTPMLGNDTLYSVTADSIYAKYFLDYGDRKTPRRLYDGFGLGRERHEFASLNNVVTATSGVFETSSFLSYQFRGLNHNLWFSFYAKNSGESFCFPYFGEDGVRDAFPLLHTGVDNTLYGHITPLLLKQSTESGQLALCYGHLENYDALVREISSLDDNANAVIVALRLKEF